MTIKIIGKSDLLKTFLIIKIIGKTDWKPGKSELHQLQFVCALSCAGILLNQRTKEYRLHRQVWKLQEIMKLYHYPQAVVDMVHVWPANDPPALESDYYISKEALYHVVSGRGE